MNAQFCLDAVEAAMVRFGKLEIMNTDQAVYNSRLYGLS